MKGLAIYQPKGAAGEYAKYACNFYVGCSNACTYCFNKRWGWGTVPTLKKCFKDKEHALQIFEKEMRENLSELQKHGLFFSFTTDPFLSETAYLTLKAMELCVIYSVRMTILTKRSDFSNDFFVKDWLSSNILKRYVAFGFTLTGHDELEQHASTNAERIEAMRKLHNAGFKTWASIEPIIDFESSFELIKQTYKFCGLYKIGLLSGAKYNKSKLVDFCNSIWTFVAMYGIDNAKIYFKDSLLKQATISRADLPYNCVDSDYNMFNN